MAFGFGDSAIDDLSAFLVAYWAMEETGSADRVDAVGSNDLTAVNTPATRTGINNNACDFIPASTEYLTRADTVDLSPTTGVVISAWVYVDLSTRVQIISKDQTYGLSVDPPNTDLYWFILQSDTTQKFFAAGSTISTGAWHNLVAMAESGFLRLYVDGSEVGTALAYDNTIQDTANSFQIGINEDISSFKMDGGIDEVGFWKNITFAGGTERDAFATALWNSGAGRFYHDLGEAFVPQVIMI